MRNAVKTVWVLCLVLGMATGTLNQAVAGMESMSANEAYLEARQAYGRGQFERALALLRHAHTKEPKSLYVYNMGRILEAIGRLQEAHETYLRVTALSVVDPKVKDLTQAQMIKLEPLLKVSVLRFRELEEDSVVQIDNDMVLSLGQDMEIKPGVHQVCVLSSKGARMSCWRRDFKAGLRTDWPVESPKATRGQLLWKGVKGAKQLSLDGYLLLLSVKKLEILEVDVGRHRVGVVGAKKKRTVQVSVISGETQKIAKLLKGSKKKKVAGIKKQKEGDSGIWPWVLAGTGGAIMIGGGAMVMMGIQAQNQADEEDDQTKFKELNDSANSKLLVGYTMLGTGLAAAGGAMWWMTRDSGSDPGKTKQAQNRRPSWWISPVGFTTVFVGGRF